MALTLGEVLRAAFVARETHPKKRAHCTVKQGFRRLLDAEAWLETAEDSCADGSTSGMLIYPCKYKPEYHVGHP